jgi:hypothetical protein
MAKVASRFPAKVGFDLAVPKSSHESGDCEPIPNCTKMAIMNYAGAFTYVAYPLAPLASLSSANARRGLAAACGEVNQGPEVGATTSAS